MKENEVIKTILTRESCRKFKPDKLSREEIEAIVTAGTYAPSAGGRQPWGIAVVTNQEIIDFIGTEGDRTMMEMMKNAPEPRPDSAFSREEPSRRGAHALPPGGFKSMPRLSGKGLAPLFVILSEQEEMTQDAASHLAAENMMLAAWSLGISSCWIGAINANVIQKHLDAPDGSPLIKKLVPPGFKLVCSLAFGYPDEEGFRRPRVERRRENVVYFE